jgi:small subunit ribosomal protein S6
MAAPQSEIRRKYEAVIIIHPDASEDEQKTIIKKNREVIQKFAGEMYHCDTWGKRKLANPIDKLTRGNYFHVTFEAKGEAIAELERTMRINERILRFQHTRLDDRVSLAKFVEKFKENLAEAAQRERDREAKNQQRRAAMMAARKNRD